MIFDVTEQNTVLALLINIVAHALCMVKLTVLKASFFVANSTCTDLFYKLISVCIED